MLNDREMQRYERQMLFAPIGPAGQERLRNCTAVVAGVGALGSVAASMLTRAGVGHLRLVDHDRVELSNLQRQMLYDEEDVQAGRPKVEAAADRLRRANSDITIESHVARIADDNVSGLVAGADVVIDAVDNFRAKFALNAAALALGIPLVYGALSGSYGLVAPIVPRRTACLCCVYREEPDAGSSETAATAGVIAPVVGMVASLQVVEAIKLLTGHERELAPGLLQVDAWDYDLSTVSIPRRPDCPACGEGVATCP